MVWVGGKARGSGRGGGGERGGEGVLGNDSTSPAIMQLSNKTMINRAGSGARELPRAPRKRLSPSAQTNWFLSHKALNGGCLRAGVYTLSASPPAKLQPSTARLMDKPLIFIWAMKAYTETVSGGDDRCGRGFPAPYRSH